MKRLITILAAGLLVFSCGTAVESPTIGERVNLGGIVGYCIIGLGIVGLLIVVWRWIGLSSDGRKVSAQLKRDGASTDNPLGRVLAAYESDRNADTETIELKLSEAALKEMPGLTNPTGQAIQDELKRLGEGKILFNPNKTMRVGERQTVEARISKSLSADLGEGLKGSGEPIIDQLKVGDFMKVNLSGDGFEIEGRSSKKQLVPDASFAHWWWNVTPIKSGRRTLTLLVTVQIKVRGVSDTSHDVPVLERDVEVLINPGYTTRRFLATHWKWIAGTIAIPTIIWAANEAGLLDWFKTWMSSISNSDSDPAP